MPDTIKKYSLEDLDSFKPVNTQEPIKPVKYTLEDLDNFKPIVPKVEPVVDTTLKPKSVLEEPIEEQPTENLFSKKMREYSISKGKAIDEGIAADDFKEENKQSFDNIDIALNVVNNSLNELIAGQPSIPFVMPITNYPTEITLGNSDIDRLVFAKEMLEQANKIKVAPKKEGLQSFWKGLTSPISRDFLSLGINELGRTISVVKADKKLQNGEQLSEEEQTLLGAYKLLEEVRNGKNLPQSYKLASGLSAMVPYMIQYALTGGASTLVKESIKGLLNATGKTTLKNIAQKGIAYTAGAAAQATLMPMSYNTIAERLIGDISEQDGVLISKPKESTFQSVTRGYINAVAETFGEGMGGILSGALGKTAKTIAKNEGFWKNFVVGMQKTAGWNGLWEAPEEEITGLIQAVVDNDWGFFTPSEQLTMLGTVAIMGGSMYGMEQAGHGMDKIKEIKIRKNYETGINKITELDKDFSGLFEATMEVANSPIGEWGNKLESLRNEFNLPEENVRDIVRFLYNNAKHTSYAASKEGVTSTIGVTETAEVEKMQLDFIKSKGIKIPNGTSSETLNEIYEQEKSKGDVFKDENKPEYLQNGISEKRNLIVKTIDNATKPEHLKNIEIRNDPELESKLSAAGIKVNKLTNEEDRYKESIDKAGKSESRIKKAEAKHKEEVSRINEEYKQELQKIATVKSEEEKKLAETKVEEPVLQPVKTEIVAEEKQKKRTVKQEKEEKLAEKSDADLIKEYQEKQKQRQIEKQNEPALPVTENTNDYRKDWNDSNYEGKLSRLERDKDADAKKIKKNKIALSIADQKELDESNKWYDDQIKEVRKERAERLQAKEKPAEKPEERKSWQMTRKEYRDAILDKDPLQLVNMNDWLINHKNQLEKAKAEGKTIPDNVKAEYPELFKEEKPSERIEETPQQRLNELNNNIDQLKKENPKEFKKDGTPKANSKLLPSYKAMVDMKEQAAEDLIETFPDLARKESEKSKQETAQINKAFEERQKQLEKYIPKSDLKEEQDFDEVNRIFNKAANDEVPTQKEIDFVNEKAFLPTGFKFGKTGLEKITEEKLTKFQQFTQSLGITKPEKNIEGATRGKIGEVDVILGESKEDGVVNLETIKTPEKLRKGSIGNKQGGLARTALKTITDEADRQGITLKLRAKPEPESKMSQSALIKWYKGNGFEFKKGSIEGIRKPKELKLQAEAERKVSEIGFYSTVEDALGKISQLKGTPEQFKAMLLKNGAKQAEMDWMDFDGTFTGKSVTKGEIQDWIEQNRIEVQEVEKGQGKISNKEITEEYHDLNDRYANDPESLSKDELDRLNELEEMDNEETPGNTKFSQYTVPGGENYKELLLTMPTIKSKPKELIIKEAIETTNDGSRWTYYDIFDKDTNEFQKRFNNKDLAEEWIKGEHLVYKNIFHSSHFDEPNILAHVRFDERTTADGEKVLFIEEIQSDWAQKGKKEGFRPKKSIDSIRDYYIKRYLSADKSYSQLSAEDKTWLDNLIKEKGEFIPIQESNLVPDMPFKSTDQWVNLALRRMMRYASENGFDRIAWTPGWIQAERYDLSKQVNEIRYFKSTNPKSGYDYDVVAEDHYGRQIFSEHLKENEIENYVGKEVAEKIINDKGSPIKYGKENPRNNIKEEGKGTLSGLDLKVGGTGMKVFYDQIIPSAVNKLGKPFGAKVEPLDIPMTKQYEVAKNTEDIKKFSKAGYTFTWNGKEVTKQRAYEIIENGAQVEATPPQKTEVQSIPVTKQMRESVMKGVPLFKATNERLANSPKEIFDAVVKRLFGTKLAKAIVTNKAEMQAKLDEYGIKSLGEKSDKVKYMATKSGEVYGFTTPDGKVYIDTEKMNVNTPTHEFGHLWMSWSKDNASDLYKKGMELADKVDEKGENNPYFQKVKDNPVYAKQYADYLKGDKEAFLDEVLATAIGDKGEQFVNEKQKASFKQWIIDLFDSIKKAMGISQYTPEQLQDITFDEFTKATAIELLKGEEIKPKEKLTEPTVKVFERPDMENPVYEYNDGKNKTYIQKSQGGGKYLAGWYEMKKVGRIWEEVNGTKSYIGDTKQEAIDDLKQTLSEAGKEKVKLQAQKKKEVEPPPSVNAKVDVNLKEAHGFKRESFLDKIKRWGGEIREITRHFKYVTESEFPSVYNKLRLFEAIPDRVKKEAYEKIMQIMKPIAKNKVLYGAFERNVVMQDLVYDIDNTDLFTDKELPWGYNNADEIRQDATKIQAYVDNNPLLKKVVEDRKAMMDQIRDELINNNLLKADTKQNRNYFHHEVLAFMDQHKGLGVSSRDVRLHKKGWQRSRTGSMQAYNTNYIESEYEVLAQSLEQLEIKSILNKIGEDVNIKPQLEKLAKSKGGKWSDYIPEGYVPWHPKSGTNAFKAASSTEKAVQNIVNQMSGNTKLLASLLSESEKTTWIIPEKISNQLDEMKAFQKEMILPRIERGINTSWKQWILLNPYRVLKYNLNNMSGDLDIVLAYAPAILKAKYAHVAMKELWADLRGRGMSQDIKEALEHGVITSGLSIQEIPDINSEGVFKSLTGKDNLIMKYWGATKDYTQFRENILRVAAYKYFKEQLKQGKIVYGASNKKAIDALTDINEKAGKLARELIGDYGNLSQGGQWLRSHIYPFWSWVEINSPRYYRLLKNTKYEGQSTTGTGARVAGIAAKKTITAAAKLTAKTMLLAGLVTLWNNIFFKDEDEELTKTGNRQLRLIVGRREDGSIMTIRISGAFSDMLAFVGLEDAPQDIKDIKEGDATIGKKLKEGGSAFVNKFAQGVMPVEKTIAEMVIGKSLYPDVFNPRPIRDAGEHGLKMVSMDKIYRYLTKKPLRGAKELTGLIVYDTNPGEAAYYTMRQRIYDFLDEQEIESPSAEPTKRSNALYYYKQSLKLKNIKLAKYWHEKYIKLGGSEEGEKTSVTKGQVISALPIKYRDEWLSKLDKEDKEVLKMANNWYSKTYDPKGILKKLNQKPKAKVSMK